MRALDLFCCAGGTTKGLQKAGFQVTGIDNKPQPRYCGDAFIQADALEPPVRLSDFDFIWASPPCQAHTALKTMHNAKRHENLIPQTRALLEASGRPWVMENVPGAPMERSLMLCGTMFGLGVDDAELRRHRVFECSFFMLQPECSHGGSSTIGVYGGHVRNRKRTIGVYGKGCRDSRRKHDKGHPDFTAEQGRAAMGIDWMTVAELSQAIPPAYSEFIGRSAAEWIQRSRAA